NGPQATVVSGDLDALEEWLPRWQHRKTSRLRVSHAFHSPRMQPMLAEFRTVCAGLTFTEPAIPVVSNLTGQVVTTELTDPDYWVRHVRQPVRFADGVHTLHQQGVTRFLELGPDAVLTAMARQTIDDAVFAAALRARQPEAETFAGFLGLAHVSGVGVDWAAFYPGARRVDLPTYAFQRDRFWLLPRAGAGDAAAAGLDRLDHPLLAGAVRLADRDEWMLTARVAQDTVPWVLDHAVFGIVIVPGSALVELAVAAGRHAGCPVLEELVLEAPLILPENAAVQLQVMLGSPDQDGRREVGIYSRPETRREDEQPEVSCHGRGVLAADTELLAPLTPPWLPVEWPPPGAEPVPTGALYAQLAEAGYEYGPLFQGVRAAWRAGDQVYTEVALPDGVDGEGFGIHPALLDAALHGGLLGKGAGSAVDLPFSWSGVRLEPGGGSRVRVRMSPAGESAVRIEIAGEHGGLVASVEKLASRPVESTQLEGARRTGPSSLFKLDWVTVAKAEQNRSDPARIVVVGGLAVPDGESYQDLDALEHAVAAAPVPDAVIVAIERAEAAGEAQAAHAVAGRTLGLLQRWLRSERLADARLVVVTRNAVAVGDEAPDLAMAPVWGLVRSAQSEHPGRFMLVDLGVGGDPDWESLIGLDEPQLAVRGDRWLAPRLERAPAGSDGAWRLAISRKGSLEDLAIVASDADRPLGRGEVRIGVRAAGLNFRDVLIALGVYPGDAPLGNEAAGTVLEVGAGVTDLAPGDRVMGLVLDAFGSVAVADRPMLVPMPAGWSFAQAASVPVVFLTAYHGLVDLAGLRRGERLLVHAAAGGVGMAAVQLARHLGAEVYATASPPKWDAVRALGVVDEQIASSRDLTFQDRFLAATGGAGVDVVLNALAGEFVDASLALLPRGGRFLEMGKADIRDPDVVAREHPGVRYRSFDLLEAGPDRIQQMLLEIVALFEQGVLEHQPIRCWDVRRARDAFRFLREGRNTGKVVLTVPAPLDPDGTVLVTGGTGGLGALFAKHLATEHGAKHLLLVSRRGPAADGVPELARELEALGATTRIAACDVADRDQLAELIRSLERPLTAVVHAAGVLDDGLVDTLTAEQLERVMRPKLDAALHLHELTTDTELSAFVLFSSVAALMGSPGQANYAAANAFLDALAATRRAAGLVASSLAWGLWADSTGMTGELGTAGFARLERTGLGALPAELGLELFDRTLGLDEALLVPVRLDHGALRTQARAGLLAPLLRGLVRTPARRAEAAGGSLSQRLAGVPQADWERVALDLVRAQVAAVLGYASPEALDADRGFKELGFDSLAAVELRNRLTQASGLRLPTTLVFDHPSPAAVATFLIAEVGDRGTSAQVAAPRPENALGTLSTLLRHAHAAGSIVDTVSLLTEASRFRPTFASADELGTGDGYVVQLASGSGLPKLVCVPSFMVGSGPHQFMRFADRLGGVRDVLVCSLPGFRGSEPAPSTWDAAIEVLEQAVRRAVGDDPFVLVGYSIGGVVAHSLAARLEATGTAPAGVVLIDTPAPEGEEETTRVFSMVMTEIHEREHEAITVDDANWLAMGTYLRLLAERAPVHVAAPSLLIRAGQPFGGSGAAWPAWDVAGDEVEVAADHFALIEDAAVATADAIESWLGG
ncbi:MAG: SDR family NAD(P)-dependent oxidoreductase, partial [Mycobacteriales bacterium]